MALHVQLRHGIASLWTSTNPILSQGEPGVETDTGQFKIGDGVTAWTSLAYQSTAGASQTMPFRSLGDGSDGNVTISSGTTTMQRDMFYNNLTISGSGNLITNGFKLFVKNNLDLTAAPVGAIQWNGNAGGNASGATGGSAPAAQPGTTIGDIGLAAAGATSTTATGTAGGVSTVVSGLGGNGGAGGRGGVGGSGNPLAGSAQRVTTVLSTIRRFDPTLLYGTTEYQAGSGGSGGSAGSGDGTNVGGGSGAGGNGGGFVAIYAANIIKSSATPAGCIQANGGLGGNGASATVGVTGGGGGGGGGSGGVIYICYNFKYGPTITNMLQATGANGGIGGDGFGTGASGANGGDAGTGGRIIYRQITAPLGFELVAPSLITQIKELTGSISFNVMLPGSDGGFNGFCQTSF